MFDSWPIAHMVSLMTPVSVVSAAPAAAGNDENKSATAKIPGSRFMWLLIVGRGFPELCVGDEVVLDPDRCFRAGEVFLDRDARSGRRLDVELVVGRRAVQRPF